MIIVSKIIQVKNISKKKEVIKMDKKAKILQMYFEENQKQNLAQELYHYYQQ